MDHGRVRLLSPRLDLARPDGYGDLFVDPMVRPVQDDAGGAGASSCDAQSAARRRLSCHKWLPDESDAYLAIKVIAACIRVFMKRTGACIPSVKRFLCQFRAADRLLEKI